MTIRASGRAIVTLVVDRAIGATFMTGRRRGGNEDPGDAGQRECKDDHRHVQDRV